MAIVRDLLIRIGFKVDKKKIGDVNRGLENLKKKVRGAGKQADVMGDKMDKAGKVAAKSLNKAGNEATELGNKAARAGNKAAKSLKKANRSASGLGAKLGVVAAGLVSVATIGAAGKFLVNTISQFQQLRAQLTTIEQDESKAEVAFARLQEFATRTPFQLENVVAAFIKLRAVGLDPTNADLTAMGDIAAGMGKDITDFAAAVVAATTGEMERLKEFGIVAKQQGNKVTFIFKGQKTTIKKESKEIFKFLTDMGKANFAGGMERQMKTIGGATSNLQDNLSKFANAVGEAGLAGEINSFIRELTGTVGESDSLAVSLGQTLGGAVSFLRDAFQFLKENIVPVVVLFTLLAVARVAVALQAAAASMTLLGNASAVATAKMMVLIAALLIIEDLAALFGGRKSFIKKLIDDGGVLGSVLGFIVDALDMVTDVFVFLINTLDSLPGPLGFIIALMLTMVTGPVPAILLLIKGWQRWKDELKLALATARGVGRDLEAVFVSLKDRALAALGFIRRGIALAILDPWGLVEAAIGGVVAAWPRLTQAADTVLNTLRNRLLLVASFLGSVFDTGVSMAEKVLDRLVQRVKELPGEIAAVVRRLPGALGSFIGSAGGALARTAQFAGTGGAPGLAGGLIGGGAASPELDVTSRLAARANAVRNQFALTIAGGIPITIQAGPGTDTDAVMESIRNEITGVLNEALRDAASDVEGAVE